MTLGDSNLVTWLIKNTQLIKSLEMNNEQKQWFNIILQNNTYITYTT